MKGEENRVELCMKFHTHTSFVQPNDENDGQAQARMGQTHCWRTV